MREDQISDDVQIAKMKYDFRGRLATYALILGIVWVIADAWVKVAEINRKPAWLTALIVVLGAIGLGPLGFFKLIMKRIRRFTKEEAARRSRLETQVDPGRTSSGLNSDGTDSKDAT